VVESSPEQTAVGADGAARRKKIAFIKRGNFSYTNLRTAEQLERAFPEYDVEGIDLVRDFLRRNPLLVVLNVIAVLWLYAPQIFRGLLTVRMCFWRTPFIFRQVRRLIRERLGPRREEFVFSVQTQSLYDAAIPGVPHFVYTDHTHLANLSYPAFSRDRLYARAWIDLEQEIYRRAEHVFVMGEHVRRSLIEHYGCAPERTSCVWAGSNIDPAPARLDNDGFRNATIIFIGVDWERKGGPTLLEAFHLVLREVPQARLVIVGCEPAVEHPRVEIAGRVSREEVKARLMRASVFCLPTRIEPFGIAAVEAFTHKLPVVATEIGAMPGLVRHGESGMLVPPDDPQALAAALLDLLRDPEKCRRFGERGHEIVVERYTWEAVSARLREHIGAWLTEHPRKPEAA
jgi:glycosyltransferase involved in cell wall biosynthesis